MSAPWNFARFLPLAERLLSRGRLPALLFAVARKGPKLGQLREDLRLMQALCLAWWRGEYRAIGRPALLAVVAALLYFLTPLDMVPDWLLAVGLLDDLAVLGWLLQTWHDELQSYRLWRESRSDEALQRIEALPPAPQ